MSALLFIYPVNPGEILLRFRSVDMAKVAAEALHLSPDVQQVLVRGKPGGRVLVDFHKGVSPTLPSPTPADTPGTVDLTPTWEALVPVLVEVAARGTTSQARHDAMAELKRLARFADGVNKSQPPSPPAEPDPDVAVHEVCACGFNADQCAHKQEVGGCKQ